MFYFVDNYAPTDVGIKHYLLYLITCFHRFNWVLHHPICVNQRLGMKANKMLFLPHFCIESWEYVQKNRGKVKIYNIWLFSLLTFFENLLSFSIFYFHLFLFCSLYVRFLCHFLSNFFLFKFTSIFLSLCKFFLFLPLLFFLFRLFSP